MTGAGTVPRRARTGDVVATVILLAVLCVVTPILVFMGILYTGFYTPLHRPAEWIWAGVLVLGPLVWAAAAIVVSILLLLRGRRAFWVPLAAGTGLALSEGVGEAAFRIAVGIG
jgi:uncharacterized membrane protein